MLPEKLIKIKRLERQLVLNLLGEIKTTVKTTVKTKGKELK